jgi:protocatechuate 3,4-dioxygenase beta subunit
MNVPASSRAIHRWASRRLLPLLLAFVAAAEPPVRPAPAPTAPAAAGKVVLRGKVVDDNDRPVAGAHVNGLVQITTPGGQGFVVSSSPVAERTTDANGAFTVEVTGPSAQMIVYFRARHENAFTPKLTELRGAALEKPITLKISPKNARAFRVRVLDEDGKPVAGAAVTAWHRVIGLDKDKPVERPAKEAWVTDREGRFELPRCLEPIGTYQLHLKADGFLVEKTAWKMPLDAGVVAFGDVTLRRQRILEGQVVDRQGKPVAAAHVVRADDRQKVEATTDEQGRFKLQTAFFPLGLLFVQKPGFRFHGQRCDTPGSLKITLLRRDEPVAKTLATLPPALPRAQRKELAARLLEPLLRRVKDKDEEARLRPLETLGRLDPDRLLEELAKKPLRNAWFDSYLRRAAVEGLLAEAPDEARTLVDSMKDHDFRSMGYLDLCDALPQAKRAEKLALLNQALLHARNIEAGDHRILQLAFVAKRLWALGEKERATKLLREGQEVARQLPTAAWAGYARGAFAEDLALIDLPAALELIKDLKDPHEYIRHHANLAHKLAGTDPAAAERVFDRLLKRNDQQNVYQREQYAQRICYRMAAADLPRARKIAETVKDPYFKARAYAVMAQALSRSRPPEALTLLDHAFELLQQQVASGKDTFNNFWNAATLAGLMVPVAEQIDPTLVAEFFWHTLSLRAPARPGLPEDGWSLEMDAQARGALALVLARYDRELAMALVEDAHRRPRQEVSGRLMNYVLAAALADPRRAVALAEKVATQPNGEYACEQVIKLLLAEGDAVWKAVDRALAQWHVDDEDL